MSGRGLLTRRRFIALAVAFTAPLLPGAVPSVTGLVDPRRAASARLLAPIQHRDSAARIGRAYLRDQPGDRNADRLLDAIVAAIGAEADGRDPLAGDDAAVAALLERRMVTEFASRDVAVVDGWLLSRTEARLYALVALS
jgi:hypothetical protein